ncbi:MAG: hypothetical protein R3270_08595 [Gammaproteobacteria bacterium]|nr:hypothetical protein [Gammaproteobacteria bacterium]
MMLGIARDGWLVVLLLAAASAVVLLTPWPYTAIPLAVLAGVMLVKFQDPDINVVPDPNGVLSPVSGKVSSICRHGEELRILIRVAPFGPYLLRAPVEGTVRESEKEHLGHGINLRTDEGEDVYLRLHGPRWFAPVATVTYGNRIGQGQRCGLLRLAAAVELVLPEGSECKVAEGNRVLAARTLLATLYETSAEQADRSRVEGVADPARGASTSGDGTGSA